MEVFLSVIIFSIVLFLYIHMNFHLNTSNDLEVYTIENVSKDRLEEISNLKQPVLFNYENDSLTYYNCTLQPEVLIDLSSN